MTKIQWANIVEAENMVRVTVSDEDCVEVLHANSQSLLPKIARSVNDNCLAGVFDEHRNPETIVTRIVRGASLAIAGDRRNTCRGAGAEESKFHSLSVVNGQ